MFLYLSASPVVCPADSHWLLFSSPQPVTVTLVGSPSSSATKSAVTACAWRVCPGRAATLALADSQELSPTAAAVTSASPSGTTSLAS